MQWNYFYLMTTIFMLPIVPNTFLLISKTVFYLYYTYIHLFTSNIVFEFYEIINCIYWFSNVLIIVVLFQELP